MALWESKETAVCTRYLGRSEWQIELSNWEFGDSVSRAAKSRRSATKTARLSFWRQFRPSRTRAASSASCPRSWRVIVDTAAITLINYRFQFPAAMAPSP